MLTPDELEVTKEVAKEGVKQMFEPVKEIVLAVTKNPATEMGLIVGDYLRAFRMRNAFRLFNGVKKAAEENGFSVGFVKPAFFQPLLEAASLEDDESLHERWVALLANAARTDCDVEILPCFPDILRQLTPDEARFMDKVYDESHLTDPDRLEAIRAANPNVTVNIPLEALGISASSLKSVSSLMIDNLERLMLVTRTAVEISRTEEIRNVMPPANHLYLSTLGKAFVRACRLKPVCQGEVVK